MGIKVLIGAALSAQLLAGAGLAGIGLMTPAGASAQEVEEVIVTATRRDTALQDAPITVSAFTEADIEREHIVNPADFLSKVSNVFLTQAVRPGEADVSMRGVQGNFGLTQPVAVVVDGVVQANPNALDQELVGIQQIEVVKGPQSALYGRNAEAGAIVITTKRPTQDTELKVVAGAGNGGEVKGQALISGSLGSDQVSGRLALSSDQWRGFWFDPTVGRPVDPYRQQIADGRVIYTPTEQLTIDMRAKASRLKEGSQLWDVQVPPFIPVDNNHYFPQFQENNDIPAMQTRYDYSVKVDYALPFGVLTAVGSYDDYASKYFADGALNTLFPGGPPTIFVNPSALFDAHPPLLPGDSYSLADGNSFSMLNERDKTFEIRLTSSSDQKIRWFFGGYYSDSHRVTYSDTRVDTGTGIVPDPLGAGLIASSSNPIISVGQYSLDTTKDTAAFGQIQGDILENLTGEVSLRFDREDAQDVNLIPDVNSPITGVPLTDPVTAPSGLVRSETFTKYQPKYTLRFKPIPEVTLFASYGLGFRAGGFNGAGTGAAVRLQAPNTDFPDAYPSETSHASELGFKSQWLDHRLQFNGAVFYTRIDDAQAFTAFPNPPITIVISLQKVRAQGAELELSYHFTDQLQISENYGLTETKIEQTDLASALGKKVPGTPEWTNSLGLDYSHALPGELTLQSRLEWNVTGPMWFDVYNTPLTQRDTLSLANARVALEHPAGKGSWQLAGWANNVFNKYYNIYSAPVPPIANFSYRGNPRMYGMDVTYRF
jgi:iron complex outermembrane receptor protein